MTRLRSFGQFWWDFIVGDEWRLAVIVAVTTVLAALAAADGRIGGRVIACGVTLAVVAAVCDVVISAGRRAGR
jgi:hypothetical protein